MFDFTSSPATLHDAATLPPRPEPRRTFAERLAGWARAWAAWFGLSRLLMATVSMAVVVVAAAWLLRAPMPPPEQALPASGGQPPTATLAPPATSSPALPSAAAPPTSIVVHVAGAVTAPGIVVLTPGGRVADAVRAAGGPLVEGDLDGLNLATPLVDGQRVYVPRRGEVDPATVPQLATSDAVGGPSQSSATALAQPGAPIDLNEATAAELDTLPGIGPATAAAIVDDRARNGPFASIDDLDRVSGIGTAKLEAIRPLVTT